MTTIKAKIERAREIIDTYGLSEKFSDEHVYELSTLTGVDLENACKIKNPKTKKDDRFLVVRFKGEPENYIGFSWAKRIRGKHGDKNYRLKEVLRNTVWHHLSNFKEHSEKECFFCGCSDDDLHVDHLYPTFGYVVKEWIKKNNYPKLVKSNTGCGYIFMNEEEEKSWQNHHYNSCSFQILCSKCNIRKSDNESIGMGALWIISLMSRYVKAEEITGEDVKANSIKILLLVGSKLKPVGDIYKRYE